MQNQREGQPPQDVDPTAARPSNEAIQTLLERLLSLVEQQQKKLDRLESIENHLTALIGVQPVRFDTPGWIARDVGDPA